MSPNETYISFDIETNGQIPGIGDMLAIGCVAFDHEGKEIASFYQNITPQYGGDTETLEWWSKQNQQGYRALFAEQVDMGLAMEMLESWMLALPGKPVLMADPGAWDGMHLMWNSITELGRYLPTKHRILDIRSAKMVKLGCGFLEANKRLRPESSGVLHNALDDAREQGLDFFEVMLS